MHQIDDWTAGREVSDRWIRTFLATVEAGSFTEAGRRLGVGQPAVSHAIKQLEHALGVRLFERSRAGVRLSITGEELAARTAVGYDLVDTAVGNVRARVRADRGVTLSVSTALATYWLMPRLAQFKNDHPGVQLRVLTQDTDDVVGRDEADLWIPLGSGPWTGSHVEVFCDERIAPVASPRYLAGLESAELERVDLLHNEERYPARYDWHRWFVDHDLDPALAAAGQRSNDYSIVVHAALEGQGVALGWLHIVQPLIDQGRLEVVGKETVKTDKPFCIVTRPGLGSRPGVVALQEWLLAEAVDLTA